MGSTNAGSQARLRWRSSVRIRTEAFGAIAYDRDRRRLVILNSPLVVEVARLLVGQRGVSEELESLELAPRTQRALLGQLIDEGMIESVEDFDERC
ncbi:MAG: mycofactocin biosynthesis chaperone MftB [Ferrimicrobium sp.]